MPPDSVVQDIDTILADCERVIARYHDRARGRDDAGGARALRAVQRDAATDERDAPRLPQQHDCRLHTHLAETRDEDDYCRRTLGLPAGRLSRRCRLDERAAPGSRTASISTMTRCAGSGGTASACAIARHRTWCSPRASAARKELEAAGVAGRARRRRLGLERQFQPDGRRAPRADDQPPASTARRRVTHLDAFRWATEGSARCLGRDDIGAIAPGSRPIWRSTRSTNCASPARAIRSPRSCCAARTAPTG